jgi:very-short-patch-repair endonuclease
VDGGQHSEGKRDLERDRCFESQGFQTLRFWNDVERNIDGVCRMVLRAAGKGGRCRAGLLGSSIPG